MENPELAVDDDEILRVCKSERLSSVGFEGDDDLSESRQTALEYMRGKMDDLKAHANRSKAMSSDIADAIETALPDLMEILAGGEDVGTFKADGPEDEDAARQETDAVAETIFDQNPGFDVLETAVKDALGVKTGIVRAWWQDYEYKTEIFERQTAQAVEQAMQSSEIVSLEPVGVDDVTGEPLFNFEAKQVARQGCAKIAAVDPANFGVSVDTIRLCDTPYCVERSFPRAFQLVDQGYDPELVAQLKPVAYNSDEEEQRARDTVEESDASPIIHEDSRRTVEVHIHTVRADWDGDGKSEIWEVVTDSEQTLILSKKRRNRVGYAAGTPFKQSHRFYGFSLADKLIEVQRIKTVLLRMMLDNGYFALNQRYEVAEAKMSLNTIADLLRNEPGYPVRSKTGDAVRPLTSATLNFDVPGALEYMATVGEQRSGIVRNAQGLNPDTLHDTKGGMEKLFGAAQRRMRMIARRLAETLLKDLFLIVHGEVRDHANHTRRAKLQGKWVDVDPTSWGNRADMTIELGVGSGGRESEILTMREIIGMQAQAMEAQASGILKVPLVTEKNVYAAARRMGERMGLKSVDLFFTDPTQALEQAAQQPPQPSPEELEMQAQQQKAEAELALKQQIAQADAQLAQAKAQMELQAMRERAQLEAELAREKAQEEARLAREKAVAEAELAKMKMETERELALMKMDLEAKLGAMRTQADATVKMNGGFQPGGRLDQ